MPKSISLDSFLLFLLLLVALYLRLDNVSQYYLSADESLHISMASGKNLAEVLQFSLYETHPPLGSILLHYWLLVSDNIAFARTFSLVFGLLLIPLYYGIGRQLKDRLTGLCCAAFVTFSYGLIIQSFMVRYYSQLVFFLSLALYFCLRWQKTPQKKYLIFYGMMAMAACVTHFSALFAVFVIFLHSVLFWKHAKPTIAWWLTNTAIAAVAISFYVIWYPTNMLASEYFDTVAPGLQSHLLLLASYPFQMLFYLLTPDLSLLCMILLLVLWLILPQYSFKNPAFIHVLSLLLLALCVGGTLLVTEIYANCWARHSVWLIPFIIPAAGIILSSFAESFPFQKHKILILVTLLIIIGLCGYNSRFRFFDTTEYNLTMHDYEDIEHYFATLDTSSVIIGSRDSAISRLVNVYPYLKAYAFTPSDMALSIPYQKTHLIFNPYYRFLQTTDILYRTLTEAQQKGMLDNVDTLLFIMSKSLRKLLACKAMPKEMVQLARQSNSTLTIDEGFGLPVTFIKIKKANFFDNFQQCSK